MDALKYTSSLALFAVFYLVGIVVTYTLVWPLGMPEEGHVQFEQIVWWNSDPMVLARLAPIFIFAFTAHQNLLYVSLIFNLF
jgi:amino acid permease